MANAPGPLGDSDYQAAIAPYAFTHADAVTRVKQLLCAAHAEVIDSTHDTWPADLTRVLQQTGMPATLLAPQTDCTLALRAYWADRHDVPSLRLFDQAIDCWKADLFQIDAALTECEGAIAATGSLIIWPTPQAPRTLSLVPPLHIVLWQTRSVWNTLFEAMQQAEWASRLPTNALLVSGPSKTADIQQTLAYGAHGPKRLIVLAIDEPCP
nr:LUD domain-containing protein [Chitinivorax tropicus]